MLGKLFKNEWTQTWKLPAVTCLATILITIIGVISFYTPLWDTKAPFWLPMIGVMLLILNIILLSASALAIFVYFSIRFYKNLYTDEGYLMHTLPVKSSQLIFSKFLVFLIWLILDGILIFFATIALMFGMNHALNMGLIEIIQEIANYFATYGFGDFYHQLDMASKYVTGLPVWVTGIVFMFFMFVSVCHAILTPYFSISIGQLFSKFKLAASIGIYVAILILQQFLATAVMLPFNMSVMMSQMESPEYHISYFYALYAPQLLFILLLTVLFYFFTHKIMKKHLNLD